MFEPTINQEIMYETLKDTPRPRYELRVFEDQTDILIFKGNYFSDQSLQEDLPSVDRALRLFWEESEMDCE